MRSQRRTQSTTPIEWPTLAVAVAIYAAFGLLTWHYHDLPWWLILPLGGFVVAWHGSLQHEVVHGHPTPWAKVNEALIFPSLWLWMPFRVYRESHLRHHTDATLTDPIEDPESFYVTAEQWDRLGPLRRRALWITNTLTGRLLLGPTHTVWRLVAAETARLVRGDTGHATAWLLHLAGSVVVLVWVIQVCAVPALEYLALFAYPGLSLTLLRSFLEHQAREDVGQRTVIVEAGPVMSLLFLNNNLHALHHAEPRTPWFALPARYRRRREALLADNGHYLMRGYGEVLARFLLWPKEPPVHPDVSAPQPRTVPSR